jgi:hypothetical protein
VTEEQTTPIIPASLGLAEVIDRLKMEDPNKVVPLGFGEPHSYRGYYEDLAFELRHNATVGEMLSAAKSAVGQTYQGWKGGDYTMKDWTACWLVYEQGDTGESIGRVLLEYMLGGGE